MNVTGEQLKKIAYERRITAWTADHCAVCDYPIKFLFNSEIDVKHDPGCHCSDHETARAIRYQTSSWDLVALWISSKTDLELIKTIKEFWRL